MPPVTYVAVRQRVVGAFGSCLDCKLLTCCSKPFQVIENFRVWNLGVGKHLSEFTTTLVVMILSTCFVQKHTLCHRCVLPLLLKTNGLRLWLIPSLRPGGCGHFAIAKTSKPTRRDRRYGPFELRTLYILILTAVRNYFFSQKL